jgi:hypothetical protein
MVCGAENSFAFRDMEEMFLFFIRNWTLNLLFSAYRDLSSWGKVTPA